jgi:hypothetical protein
MKEHKETPQLTITKDDAELVVEQSAGSRRRRIICRRVTKRIINEKFDGG